MRPFRRGRGTMAGSGNLITLLFTALGDSDRMGLLAMWTEAS